MKTLLSAHFALLSLDQTAMFAVTAMTIMHPVKHEKKLNIKSTES